MGSFIPPRQRTYVPPLGSAEPASGGSSGGFNPTLLGGSSPDQPMRGPGGDPNIIRVADPDSGMAGANPPPRRGAAPFTELPPGTPLKDGPGQPVILPDGSHVPDPSSATGYLMSPVGDLSNVATAGRDATESSRVLRSHPSTFEAGMLHYGAQFGFAIGHGGAFDYQRGPGNSITGFEQRRQFRNVSNVNVGLFGQQAGWSLDQVLRQAGEFARLKSGNWTPDQPYGLDTETRKFIELGHKIGTSGVFGPAALP